MELKKSIQKRIENFEICPKCLTEYEQEDFITEYERVPYGSTYAHYPVDVGVRCHNCGYFEEI